MEQHIAQVQPTGPHTAPDLTGPTKVALCRLTLAHIGLYIDLAFVSIKLRSIHLRIFVITNELFMRIYILCRGLNTPTSVTHRFTKKQLFIKKKLKII